MHVLRNAGSRVKRNRCPYPVNVLFRDVMAAQEVARGIGSINLKAVCVAAVSGYKTDVMKHSACVQEFGVELETAALTGECAEVVDAAGVIEEESRGCIPDQ